MENQTTQRPASDLGAFDAKWVTLSDQGSAGIARRQIKAEAILARERAKSEEERTADAAKRDKAPMARQRKYSARLPHVVASKSCLPWCSASSYQRLHATMRQ
jgi:hypothetical protein